jgi:DNA invertase Pin-like site-specific DNA recombinase
MDVVGYARVSTAEQGANGYGLEAQRRAIARACCERGWSLLRVEEDIQSGASRRRRPGLDAALAACRSGEAAGLVAARLDRLSRSVVDCGALLDEASRGHWNLVALDFGLDLSTPQGELVANVLASVARWERRIIGDHIKDGLAVKRARGERLGGPRSVPERVATRIRRARSCGLTWQRIADLLDRDGVPTGRGAPAWSPSAVRRVALRSQAG